MKKIILTGMTVLVLAIAALPLVAVVAGNFDPVALAGQKGDDRSGGREYGFQERQCNRIESKLEKAERQNNEKKETKLERRFENGNCDRF